MYCIVNMFKIVGYLKNHIITQMLLRFWYTVSTWSFHLQGHFHAWYKVGCNIIFTFTSELKGKGTRFFHQSNVGCDIFLEISKSRKGKLCDTYCDANMFKIVGYLRNFAITQMLLRFWCTISSGRFVFNFDEDFCVRKYHNLAFQGHMFY
jgi:hypothetical protein